MQPLRHCRIRLQFFYGVDRIRKAAAAAGAERGNCFTGKIIAVEKCVKDHRHISPPVRIAHIDHIIVRNIFNAVCNRRPGVFALFCLRQIHNSIIIVAVRRGRDDFKNIRICLALDRLCNIFSIARPRKIDNQRFRAGLRSFRFRGRALRIGTRIIRSHSLGRIRLTALRSRGSPCVIRIAAARRQREQQGKYHKDRSYFFHFENLLFVSVFRSPRRIGFHFHIPSRLCNLHAISNHVSCAEILICWHFKQYRLEVLVVNFSFFI